MSQLSVPYLTGFASGSGRIGWRTRLATRFARRLSGKDFGGDISAGSVLSVGSERLALGPAARLSGGYPVVVELQEVVGGGYQPPFGLHRGPASSLEAVVLAVELDVAVDRFDLSLPFAVDRSALGASDHAAHERVEPAV